MIKNNNDIPVVESYLSVENGILVPDEYPRTGKKILLGRPARAYKSMCVGDRGRISDEVRLFDTLYYSWGYDIVVVQVMPTDDPRFGIIRSIKSEPLEKNSLGEQRGSRHHSNQD